MRVEALCTGDELVTGLIADTNSPYFQAKLLQLGVKVGRVQHVGDVREEIVRALRDASGRADEVLVSGGLGPTADDITASCAAEAAGVPLVEDPGTLRWLEERFARRGVAFTPNNARQAQVPEGAEVVRNPVGTAPLFILRMGGCRLFFVPGVPREYRALVDQEVLPRIAGALARAPRRTYRAFRLLRTVGIAESHLDDRMAPLAREHPQVTFGFRTEAPENHLKLLAEGESQAAAHAALEAAEKAAREVLGLAVYGSGDDSYEELLLALLREAGATVAVAESCTGGMIAERLTRVPGASEVLVGGAVAYVERMKVAWAGVPEALLARHGAVSREVVEAMARGVRAVCGATFGLAVTGYAGPGGGTAADPVGTVYCALAGPGDVLRVERRVLPGDRQRIRLFAASDTLELLRRHLLSERPTS